MKQHGNEKDPNDTFHDVLVALDTLYESPSTRRDYSYAIKKCPEVYSCKSLEDIRADISEFEQQFPRNGYSPTMSFKSDGSYRSWRKKVLAALRKYFGLIDHQVKFHDIVDGWSVLLTKAGTELEQRGIAPQRLIPLKILGAEGRKMGIQPTDLSSDVVSEIAANLVDGRLDSFRKVVPLLRDLRTYSIELSHLVPRPDVFSPLSASPRAVPPLILTEEAVRWIESHCLGAYDEINEEFGDARSDNTRSAYLSAFNSYLSTAADCGMLNNVRSLSEALQPDVFLSVLRAWLRPADSKRLVSNCSALQYVRVLRMFSHKNDVSTSHIGKMLETTRQFKDSKRQNKEISKGPRNFCAWLLASRKGQLEFLSLHVRFYNRSKFLLDLEKSRPLRSREEDELRQTGSLAAMTAICLWFAPLRVDNLVNLTISGQRPLVFMPNKKRDHSILLVPMEMTKNKKPIRKKMTRNSSRSLEILEWYLSEIRSRHPDAFTSNYLFPGYGTRGGPITDETVRRWLKRHCRSVGFYPISPHWFRHGVASMFLQSNPGAYTHVGRLLDDNAKTVKKHYAFIDDERLVDEAQMEWLKIAGFEQLTSNRESKRRLKQWGV